MEERKLKKWAEFKKIVDEIRDRYGYHEYAIGNGKTHKRKNIILFRGQNNAKWSLETTLERKTKKTYSVDQYISRAIRLVPELEAYTGKKWDIPFMSAIKKELDEKQNNTRVYLPHYNYLVYLRHHGYPSPLLDWSESPYIAAYFAMAETSDDKEFAVFSYIDSVNSGKSFWGECPALISVFGPFVSTDKRHFMQQAWYTTATKWSKEKSQHNFCSHDEVFSQSISGKTQDILIKITLPASERKVALMDLYDYNINHFTLFQTEDSLAKTLSIKNFDLDRWN